jgi:hypothetical protein
VPPSTSGLSQQLPLRPAPQVAGNWSQLRNCGPGGGNVSTGPAPSPTSAGLGKPHPTSPAAHSTAAPADHKLKRSQLGATTDLALVANPDLLAELGKRRGAKPTPLLVGFAAETHDVIANAKAKLAAKGCDLIIANDVSEPGAGFGTDTNRVTIVDHAGVVELPAGPKSDVAHRILDRIVAHPAATKPAPRAPRSRSARSPTALAGRPHRRSRS